LAGVNPLSYALFAFCLFLFMKSLFSVLRAKLALPLLLCAVALPAAAKPYACLQTNVGEFCMELFPDKAPATVANFLSYINDGSYTDSMIHRSVPGFVIQGGGYKVLSNLIATMVVKPAVVNEYNQSNLRGTVAMARIGGQVNSATSQWFVNLADNTFLDSVDGGFTVFAKVVNGSMGVVNGVAAQRVVDLSATLGGAFTTVPTTAPAGTTIDSTQLIRVMRAYTTDTLPGVLPYQCSLDSPADTLTEFCGTSLVMPVAVGGTLLQVTLNYVPGRAGFVFAVDPTQLKVLTDSGQARTTFSGTSLSIPSVRVGAAAFVNVHLTLTNATALEFTVDGATPR
jgi:peptidyl-prolyl cis-trans isomerase A (cyclophilin A)